MIDSWYTTLWQDAVARFRPISHPEGSSEVYSRGRPESGLGFSKNRKQILELLTRVFNVEGLRLIHRISFYGGEIYALYNRGCEGRVLSSAEMDLSSQLEYHRDKVVNLNETAICLIPRQKWRNRRSRTHTKQLSTANSGVIS